MAPTGDADAGAATKEWSAWVAIAQERAKELENTYCYAVDWFPESLPLENKYGSCMHDTVQRFLSPGSAVFGLPVPEDDPPNPPPAQNVLVFSDSHGYCKGILDMAPKGRIGKKNVITKHASQISQQELAKLLDQNWDLIIFGCGVDMPASNSVSDIIKQQDAVTKLYFFLTQEICRKKESTLRNLKGLAVITVDTFAEQPEIHHEMGLGLTTSATLFGMSNTARQELDVPLQYIETEWSLPQESMAMLSSEVFRMESFGKNTVRILKDGRYCLRQVVTRQYADAGQRQLPLPDKGGIVAISGGNGALAMVLGEWLLHKAREVGKSGFAIKFLSRSMKIGDENAERWGIIQKKAASLGITVEQAKCDVSKQSAVHEFIEQCGGNLEGFIHAAGVLRDGMLLNQTWDKFEEVFDGKSRAALYLHEALERFENPRLKFFWMFSSTSVYGNMGQINYGGSNSFMDALARHRKAVGLPGMVVQWGAWGEVGMAANLDAASKQRFAAGPCPPFANSEGLSGFEVGIRSGLPYFSVFKYNPPVMFGIVDHIRNCGHAYYRNFLQNVFPLPNAKTMDDVYDFIRSQMGGTVNEPLENGLVYGHFYNEESDGEW